MSNSRTYKSFPYLSTFYFWNRIGKTGKKLFWITFITLLLSGIYAIIPTFLDFEYFIPYHSYAEHFLDNLSIKKSEEGFPIELYAPVFYNFQVFVADKIQMGIIPVIIYLIFWSIGWSLLLSVSSKIEGFLFYLLYFLFGSTMIFSQAGICLIGEDPMRLVSFAIIMVFILLAYRYKTSDEPVSLYHQFFRFFILFLIFFLSIFIFRGRNEIFHFAYYSFPVSAILSIIFLIWTAKDLAFAVILWATNHREPSKRWETISVYFIIFGIFCLGLYWTLGLYFHFGLPKLVSPILLLCLSACLSILSSQAFYAEVQENFSGNLPFIILHYAAAILTLSFIGFIGFNAEPLTVLQIERFFAFFLTAFSLGTLIFLYFNFHGLLQFKTNIFFVLHQPNTLSFKAIFLAALAGLVVTEGYHKWRSIHLFMSTYFDQIADYQLILGNTKEASEHYIHARISAVGNPKPNYNYGCINGKNDEQRVDVLEMYKASYQVIPFDAAELNIGFYQKNPRLSIDYYLSLKNLSEKIYNNLGYFYFKINNLDSAVICWKKALAINPNVEEVSCNLAVLYNLNGKKDWAKNFVKFIPSNTKSVHNQVNMLYLSLALDTHFVAMRNYLQDSLYTLNYNQAIIQLQYQDPQKAMEMVKKLEKQFDNEYLPFVYLKMLSHLWQGEVFAGQDMARYISEYFPEYQKQVWHTVASFYYFMNMPEMAIEPFRKAENAIDSLNAIYMQLLAGHHDISVADLHYMKVQIPTHLEKIRHELALLFKAYNAENLQIVEWDLQGMTYYEALRGAHYATLADEPQSTEFFLDQLKKFKDNPKTWIRILESFLHFQDKRLLAAADSAMFHYPNHPEILSMAEYVYALNKKNLEKFKNIPLQNDFIRYYKAKTLFILKDYQKSEEILQSILRHNPYGSEAVILMADVYKAKNQRDKELELLSKTLVKNEKSYRLWYRYYQYQKEFQFKEEVQVAMENLLKYAPSNLREKIQKDYLEFQKPFSEEKE